MRREGLLLAVPFALVVGAVEEASCADGLASVGWCAVSIDLRDFDFLGAGEAERGADVVAAVAVAGPLPLSDTDVSGTGGRDLPSMEALAELLLDFGVLSDSLPSAAPARPGVCRRPPPVLTAGSWGAEVSTGDVGDTLVEGGSRVIGDEIDILRASPP